MADFRDSELWGDQPTWPPRRVSSRHDEEIGPAPEFHWDVALWLAILAGVLCWTGLGFAVWALWGFWQ